jgi:hypothetical protein
MNEAIKVTCVVVLMFGTPIAAFAWADDRPSETTWALRLCLPAISVAAIALFLRLHFRADKVPDFLSRRARRYFNRKGFCFAPFAENRGGICFLAVYFQNQQDAPCIGWIAVQPGPDFFMRRPAIPAVVFQIDCEAAAFGIARVAVPLPRETQGKRQSFEVGASVNYFQGRGRTVRFRDGTLLSTACNFENERAALLGAAGLLTGHILISFPVRTAIDLPAGVAVDFTPDGTTEVQTLWKLGDPPLVASS